MTHSESQELSAYVSTLRRYFHRHPEISLKETETALKIESELDRSGIEHERVGETGVIGYIRGAAEKKGPIIALRADIDALPIVEKTTADYASENPGVMHACGHDAHIASLLGAARYLSSHREALSGEVRLFFQQAEEAGFGARKFIECGHIDGVASILGIHVSPLIPSGKIGLMGGPANSSCDYFKIAVKGSASHVSAPHLGIDAVYIASSIVVSLQSIVARRTNPLDAVVVGVGLLSAGTAYNIVAGEAFLEGTTRSFTPASRKKTNELVVSIAEQTARLHGGNAEAYVEETAAPLVNDEQAAAYAREIAANIIGAENVLSKIPLSLTADDFADYLEKVPGIYAVIGTQTDANPATSKPLHHEEFDIDEAALMNAVSLYADFALGYDKYHP